MTRLIRDALVMAVLAGGGAGFAAEPKAVWNANLNAVATYQPISPEAKVGQWVYVDARLLHPTQFCLGYREVTYKAKVFDALSRDAASHDPKAALYPYLAKKDIPIIVGPDGTYYLTDGHHTLAALLASTQGDRTAFGHIVANYFGKSRADFVAFMTDPKNNDVYLYGVNGNGLLNSPGALVFEKLPATVYSNAAAGRMENDVYRSLGWAMKDSGYSTKASEKRGEDELFENFIEFRWADLFRNKIIWNNESDESFDLAAANADALARSEGTTDMTGGFAARDMPGFWPAKKSDSFIINLTDQTRIEGDIVAPAKSSNTLAINTTSTLIMAGKLANFAAVQINAGSKTSVSMDKGGFVPEVTVPAGTGMVILSGASTYAGATTVAAGELVVNGSIEQSAVEVKAGAMLRGVGQVGEISGNGMIWPGSSVGILTAAGLSPAAGMKLAFELTGAEVDYGQALASRNDLLVLTGGAPFEKPLEAGEEIDVYLRGELREGASFSGGIFCKTPFAADVAGAAVQYFVADPQGTVMLGAMHYRAVDMPRQAIVMEVVPATAAFSGGTVAGYVTRFTVKGKR